MRRHHVLRASIVAVLLVAAAGCGSTLQAVGQGPAGDPDSTMGPGADLSKGTSGGDQGLSIEGPTSGAPSSGTATVGTGTVVQKAATTVKVGYLYSDDAQAASAQFGDDTVPRSETVRAIYQAVADDLNRRGGILGRRVVLVGHNISTYQQLSNPAIAEQEMCTDFTQDHPVFAVLDGFYVTGTPCLSRQGVASIGTGVGVDAKMLHDYLFYSPANVLAERYMPVYVDRLVKQGYFQGWDNINGGPGSAPVKIGLFYADDQFALRWFALLKKALAVRGYHVDPDNEVRSRPGVDGWAAAAGNAVLKLRSNDVTHVFSGLAFEPQAESQHYRPRYAVDSITIMWGNTPAQLHGSLGVGWWPHIPISQLGNQPPPPPPVSPAQTRCEEIMTKAGISGSRVVALRACSRLWSLAGALERGGEISLSALDRGFDNLGTVQSPLTFTETWAPDRHASASTLADVRYDDDCECYIYTNTRTRF